MSANCVNEALYGLNIFRFGHEWSLGAFERELLSVELNVPFLRALQEVS